MASPEQKVSALIVRDLITDLNDRQGFETNDIDDKTMQDWKTSWRVLINVRIRDAGGINDEACK